MTEGGLGLTEAGHGTAHLPDIQGGQGRGPPVRQRDDPVDGAVIEPGQVQGLPVVAQFSGRIVRIQNRLGI